VADRPTRIQLSRAKGWRLPAGAVKVDRTTRWGNPFHHHGDGAPMDRALAVRLFERLLNEQGAWAMRGTVSTIDDARRELGGRTLACWCALDQPCHAEVLLRLANEDRGHA
jgi:hypothetical protein